jgi:hypothetical protein
MQQERRDAAATLGILAILVVIATTVGYLLASEGRSVLTASFTGASLAVYLLVLYGACYQLWARVVWGAPFLIGDTVRIAKGPHRGFTGRVISLCQGVEVEVEFNMRGEPHRERFLWGALRKDIQDAA